MNIWVYLAILYLAMGFGYAIIIDRLSLRETSSLGRFSGKTLFDCFRGMMSFLCIGSQVLSDLVAHNDPDKSLLGTIPVFWVIPVTIDIVTSIFLLIAVSLTIVGMKILLAITFTLSLSGSLIQRNRVRTG